MKQSERRGRFAVESRRPVREMQTHDWLALLVAAKSADILSTLLGLAGGLREGNKAVASLMHANGELDAMVSLSIGALVFIVLTTELLCKVTGKGTLPRLLCYGGPSVLWYGAAVWNTLLLAAVS